MSEGPRPPRPESEEASGPPRRNNGMLILLFLLALVLLVVFGTSPEKGRLSEDGMFVALYEGRVQDVVADDAGTSFQVTLEDGRTYVVPVLDAGRVASKVRELQAKARSLAPPIPYQDFVEAVEDGRIHPLRGYPLRIIEREDPEDPDAPTVERQRFFVDYADETGIHYAEVESSSPDDSRLDVAALIELLQRHDADVEEGLTFHTDSGFETDTTSGFMTFLLFFGPTLLFVFLLYFLFMRQMRGQGQGLLSFGRSRAQVWNKEKRTGVTFDDVAGIEEALEEVKEITEFLAHPEKFTRLGGRIPRGVLMVGPPGTGKTLLAKAIAGEAGVPFLSASGSDFVEMFVGVGASRVRDLFEQARKEAPCIIFLDEIDAVGRKRGLGISGGNDEREQTLNAILVEMDGFSTDDRIIVIAATNRPDVLDSALLRPGRFDREIVIDLPDVKGREKILEVHTRKIRLDPSVDLSSIARGTPGFSGAELAALCNEAAIIAAMREHKWVTQEDLEEARDKVRFGRQKKGHVMEPEDKKITAYHEAGHAVVNAFMEHADPVHKVTIIPRGMSLGSTMMLPEKDRAHWTRQRLLDDICVSYGGRVAEELFCDDITTGASSDIQRATVMAQRMITRWGMSEKLGPVDLSEYVDEYGRVQRELASSTQRVIDEEVAEILQTQHDRAKAVLEEHRELVERVTAALLEFETITADEFQALVDGADVEDLRKRPKGGAPRTTPPPLPRTDEAAAPSGDLPGTGPAAGGPDGPPTPAPAG